MGNLTENINKNPKILLARNTPVALVVGAATFFGSHLVDKLLSKNIQVVGVDDLSSGKKENLVDASGNKNFHLIIDSVENLALDLERLDYIFIIPRQNENVDIIFKLYGQLKARLLLISSVDLYDKSQEKLNWLKEIESEVAREAKEKNLNARIIRLGPVYGPRMNFDPEDFLMSSEATLDPMIKLIGQSLTEDLQKDTTMEFSTRALYIDEAIDLAIKCIFAGATAEKIFDGVSPTPIKVAEIKQVLLDPIWYESRDFRPTELPPWPTPNLLKTKKFLNWYPNIDLVSNLRVTLQFFKDNEIKVPKFESKFPLEESKKWKKEQEGELQGLKMGEIKEKGSQAKKPSIIIPRLLSLFIACFVMYALIWPFFQMGWGILTFRFQLLSAIGNLEKGEFAKSLSSINLAQNGVDQAKSIFYSLEPIRQTGVLKKQFETGDNMVNLATYSSEGAQNTILGIQALYQSLKSVTGESSESPKDYFDKAQTYLASADEDLSKADALIKAEDFKSNLPSILKNRVSSLAERLVLYSNLVKKARALSVLLPEIVALESSKSYLILLQNNNELRPTGGFIGSFAKVAFEGGKLKKLEVNDVYEIDGHLNIHVEPPKEIKEDLNQKDYFLRDSNWEPDFPTSARQVEWFYTKETGDRVDGVVALDISAIEHLLSVVGPLDLPDYNEKITADNLFEKAISHAEVNFFPGTQAKKSFLTALSTSLFNKLFFLPNQNWPALVSSLGKSLEEKHMSIYLDNPGLFSYVTSQNWAAVLPRGSKEQTDDFLALVEANLGANKANYYLDRKYNLETMVGKEGQISHRVRILYTNRSPSDVFPAGKYKNRMRIYLPSGSKLNKALWGESDITSSVSNFADYGRAGLSVLLELLPKEQKTLVLDYQTPVKLDFKNNIASYRLDIVKQAGTLKDPLDWTISYPINMKLKTNQVEKNTPQQYSIKTDLSTDKTFKLEFSH